MLNVFFVVLVLLSVLVAAFTGHMDAVSSSALDAAKTSVELALGLVGVMSLFMGLMKVASDGGLLRLIAAGCAPVMRRLFPDVPEDHPAMSAMILNIGSNILGLGNAATPFGIRAMQELGNQRDGALPRDQYGGAGDHPDRRFSTARRGRLERSGGNRFHHLVRVGVRHDRRDPGCDAPGEVAAIPRDEPAGDARGRIADRRSGFDSR